MMAELIPIDTAVFVEIDYVHNADVYRMFVSILKRIENDKKVARKVLT